MPRYHNLPEEGTRLVEIEIRPIPPIAPIPPSVDLVEEPVRPTVVAESGIPKVDLKASVLIFITLALVLGLAFHLSVKTNQLPMYEMILGTFVHLPPCTASKNNLNTCQLSEDPVKLNEFDDASTLVTYIRAQVAAFINSISKDGPYTLGYDSLVGNVSLRQYRVKLIRPQDCPHNKVWHKLTQTHVPRCILPWSPENADYGPHPKAFTLEFPTVSLPASIDDSHDYGPSSHAVNLILLEEVRNNVHAQVSESARQRLRKLYKNSWTDGLSRGVVLHYAMHDLQTGLFTDISLFYRHSEVDQWTLTPTVRVGMLRSYLWPLDETELSSMYRYETPVFGTRQEVIVTHVLFAALFLVFTYVCWYERNFRPVLIAFNMLTYSLLIGIYVECCLNDLALRKQLPDYRSTNDVGADLARVEVIDCLIALLLMSQSLKPVFMLTFFTRGSIKVIKTFPYMLRESIAIAFFLTSFMLVSTGLLMIIEGPTDQNFGAIFRVSFCNFWLMLLGEHDPFKIGALVGFSINLTFQMILFVLIFEIWGNFADRHPRLSDEAIALDKDLNEKEEVIVEKEEAIRADWFQRDVNIIVSQVLREEAAV